jgi:hypothetical protein
MPALARRRFDHLATELSVALGILVPRHALWQACADKLASADDTAAFCDEPLDAFLELEQLAPPSPAERARLRREVSRFDPSRRTPDEILSALFGDVANG